MQGYLAFKRRDRDGKGDSDPAPAHQHTTHTSTCQQVVAPSVLPSAERVTWGRGLPQPTQQPQGRGQCLSGRGCRQLEPPVTLRREGAGAAQAAVGPQHMPCTVLGPPTPPWKLGVRDPSVGVYAGVVHALLQCRATVGVEGRLGTRRGCGHVRKQQTAGLYPVLHLGAPYPPPSLPAPSLRAPYTHL